MKAQAPLHSTVQSSFADICRLLRLPVPASARCARVAFTHRTVKAGGRLITQGAPLDALYVVRSGWFRTFADDDGGNETVMEFPATGDLVGADGLGEQVYAANAVALTDSTVVVIPCESLEKLGRQCESFDLLLCRAISRALVEEQTLRSLSGVLSAEARVGRFLARLARKSRDRGDDGKRVHLPMKRQDIGSYLGLTVETVSRALSALDDAGLVRVDLREIEILDEAALLAPANRPLRAPAPPAVKPAPARTRIARRNTTWADMLGAAAA